MLIFPKKILVLIMLIFVVAFSIQFNSDNKKIVLYEQNNLTSNIGPIKGQDIKISFNDIQINKDPNILCLKFATYNRVHDSVLWLRLYNYDNEKIYSKKINTKRIVDGANYCININKMDSSKISKYYIKIRSLKKSDEDFVTLYKDKQNDHVAILLARNDDSKIRFSLIIMTIVSYLIINIMINLFSNKISESKYLLLLLLYIIPLVFIIPPFTSPDENLHFYQTYSASQVFEIGKSHKINLPNNIECLNYSYKNINFKVDNKEKILKCSKSGKTQKYDIDKSPGMKRDITPSAVSIGYLFQAISLKIVDVFSNSPLILYYIPKLLATLATFIILYFCVDFVPKYKKTMLYLITMPMFVQQLCSFSYDSILNLMVILLFTIYISVISKKEKDISKTSYILLFLISFYLITLKIVYFPLLFILMLIPSNKFKNKTKDIIIILIGAFVCKYLFQKLFIITNVVESISSKQINFIMNNPIYMVTVIKNTFALDGWNYVKGIYGFFSWFKYGFNDIIILISMIFMILLFNSERSLYNKDNVKKIRTFLLTIIIIISGLIFASMYFCWNYNYKLFYIAGVQGRYFLPLLPLVFLVLSPLKCRTNISSVTLYSVINLFLFNYLLYSIMYFY